MTPKYSDDSNAECKYQISFTTRNYIISLASVTKYSLITSAQFPWVINIVTENTYCK